MKQTEKKDGVRPILSSFRDPASFVYTLDGFVYRQINPSGLMDYQHLMSSGLYDRLVGLNYLISHKEVSNSLAADERATHVLQPEQLGFVSYPYEWCFSQLKNAAILTLKITQIALEFGMILKDANAYNIQFLRGHPILIDTGSFKIYSEGRAWEGYRQFCQHFLAPLALMALKDHRLSLLSKLYIDGIPLDLASKLLPVKSKLSFSLMMHIHAHAKSQAKYGNQGEIASKTDKTVVQIKKNNLLGLLDNLLTSVNKLKWHLHKTEWGDYYDNTNYPGDATRHKRQIVDQLVTRIQPRVVWDLGGNNGYYSRIAANCGAEVISFDVDPMAVELNLEINHKQKIRSVSPLLMDLTNPSSAIGWAHSERDSLRKRSPADLIMALALIHHLAISNNVPLIRIAEFFSLLSDNLLIEFVPKNDSQVRRLLASRKDIFPNYHIEGFEDCFSYFYDIIDKVSINKSDRILYIMKKRHKHSL